MLGSVCKAKGVSCLDLFVYERIRKSFINDSLWHVCAVC